MRPFLLSISLSLLLSLPVCAAPFAAETVERGELINEGVQHHAKVGLLTIEHNDIITSYLNYTLFVFNERDRVYTVGMIRGPLEQQMSLIEYLKKVADGGMISVTVHRGDKKLIELLRSQDFGFVGYGEWPAQALFPDPKKE